MASKFDNFVFDEKKADLDKNDVLSPYERTRGMKIQKAIFLSKKGNDISKNMFAKNNGNNKKST
jgi:hypothetical protein|tara:strand:+ start:1396 stop:1587 length:192 start_codon:yes stop_codon:yes gene_type:complete